MPGNIKRQRSGSAKRSNRGRSRSINALTENSEQRTRGKDIGAPQPSGHRVNQTAAQEIFHAPFEYQHSSHSNLATTPLGAHNSSVGYQNINSRRSSKNGPLDKFVTGTSLDATGNSYNRAGRRGSSNRRQRSISVDQSHEEKKSDTSVVFGKKRGSTAGKATPGSSKKVAAGKTDGNIASKTAK